MSSRGAFIRNGHVTTNEYKAIDEFGDAKIVVGNKGIHSLPDFAHTPNRKYIKTNKDGSFRELRDFDSKGRIIIEIGYHGEVNLTGNRHEKILHYHLFDDNLNHLEAHLLDENSDLYRRYKNYLRRFGL